MHRVRSPVVPVSPGPRRPAHEGVRTVLQAARRRPAVPVSRSVAYIVRRSSPHQSRIVDPARTSSSFEWNAPPYDVPDAHAKAGTPCNNYNGYCDVFQRCREVDPSGPLATLRRLLLSDESIASLKRWVEDHWYCLS